MLKSLYCDHFHLVDFCLCHTKLKLNWRITKIKIRRTGSLVSSSRGGKWFCSPDRCYGDTLIQLCIVPADVPRNYGQPLQTKDSDCCRWSTKNNDPLIIMTSITFLCSRFDRLVERLHHYKYSSTRTYSLVLPHLQSLDGVTSIATLFQMVV